MKKEHIIQNLKFIGITVSVGVVLIVFLFTFESNPFKDSDFENSIISNKSKIESDIELFNGNGFDPYDFPIILTEISSSSEQGLVRKSAANYLNYELVEAYKRNVFDKCEYFLVNGGDEYSKYMGLLRHLENSIGKDEIINEYKSQIEVLDELENVYLKRVYNYFSTTISEEFYNYNEYINTTYIQVLNNPNGLNKKYKNKRIQGKLNSAIKNLKRLESAYGNYYMFNDFYLIKWEN